MAGLIGVVLAGAVILFRYMLNDTVKTAEDVEKYLGLSTLGTIPVTKSATGRKKVKKSTKVKKKKTV